METITIYNAPAYYMPLPGNYPQFDINDPQDGQSFQFNAASGKWINSNGGGLGDENGWSPVILPVVDGSRIVLRVNDWIGGSGSKPVAGKYLAASGFVDTAAEAQDIRGSQGPQGIQGTPGSPGEDGAPGENGNTILSGAGIPPIELGVDGDFYIDPAAQLFYGPKSDGAWPAGVSYKGNDGAPGTPGTPGEDGDDGAPGTPGRSVQVFDGVPAGDFGVDYFEGDIVKF